MARRIEVIVPESHVEIVRSIIRDKEKVNISLASSNPGIITEIPTTEGAIIYVTVPGQNVPVVMKNLEKCGIGARVGSVSLQSLDCLKPRFIRHQKAERNSEETKKKRRGSILEALPFGQDEIPYRDYRKAPLTLDEVYGIIVTNSHMTTTTWINLLGASVVGAGGAATNNVVFVVAAMLVSPIMGPVLGVTFAYRVADWKLLQHAAKNLFYQSLGAWLVGFFITIPLGLYNMEDGQKWNPNPETISSFADSTNLIFSSVVAAAAGVILGNAILKTTGGNSLIGIAITAGLLPPVVFSGMLLSFGIFHASGGNTDDDMGHFLNRRDYYDDSKNTILAYFIHLICIGLMSNFIFFLKDVNPNFRDLDDINVKDVPSNKRYRQSQALAGFKVPDENSSWWQKLTPYWLLSLRSNMKKRSSNSQIPSMNPSSAMEGDGAQTIHNPLSGYEDIEADTTAGSRNPQTVDSKGRTISALVKDKLPFEYAPEDLRDSVDLSNGGTMTYI